MLALRKEAELLREEVALKHGELSALKANLALAAQTAGGQAGHFAALLESQSREAVRLKRVLEECERREKQCARKWQQLLAENLALQERAKGQAS